MDSPSNVSAPIHSNTGAGSAEPTAERPSQLTAAAPRLAPIDRSTGFLHWLLRLAFRVQLGKVMMPLRVIFPRIPRYMFAHFTLLYFYARGLTIPRTLRHLLAIRVSDRNQCSFCSDAHRAFFMLEKPSRELLRALDGAAGAGPLDPATQAALAYADEVTATGRASDACFAALRAHWNEQQIVEIAWVVAFTVYLNLLARPLGIGSDGFCDLVRAKQAAAASRR